MGLFDFHFTMTDFPVFTEHFVESSHMGTTYYIPQWQEPPFIPAPIPPFEEHMERMFYVYVSDYVLNSAFHAGFLSGLLDYNVTTDLVRSLVCYKDPTIISCWPTGWEIIKCSLCLSHFFRNIYSKAAWWISLILSMWVYFHPRKVPTFW